MGTDSDNKKNEILAKARAFLDSFEYLGDLSSCSIKEFKEDWTNQFDAINKELKTIEGFDHLQEFVDFKFQKMRLEKNINRFIEVIELIQPSLQSDLTRTFGYLPARAEAEANIQIDYDDVDTLVQAQGVFNSIDEKIEEELSKLKITDKEIFEVAKRSPNFVIELKLLKTHSPAKEKFIEDVKTNLDDMFGKPSKSSNREITYYIPKRKSMFLAKSFGIDFREGDILIITAGINKSEVSAGLEGTGLKVPYTMMRDYPARSYIIQPESDTIKASHSSEVQFMHDGTKAKLVARIYLNIATARPSF